MEIKSEYVIIGVLAIFVLFLVFDNFRLRNSQKKDESKNENMIMPGNQGINTANDRPQETGFNPGQSDFD